MENRRTVGKTHPTPTRSKSMRDRSTSVFQVFVIVCLCASMFI